MPTFQIKPENENKPATAAQRGKLIALGFVPQDVRARLSGSYGSGGLDYFLDRWVREQRLTRIVASEHIKRLLCGSVTTKAVVEAVKFVISYGIRYGDHSDYVGLKINISDSDAADVAKRVAARVVSGMLVFKEPPYRYSIGAYTDLQANLRESGIESRIVTEED